MRRQGAIQGLALSLIILQLLCADAQRNAWQQGQVIMGIRALINQIFT
jgi:hypothetical protein